MNMESALEQLRNAISQIQPIDDMQWNSFSQIWEESSAARMQLLTSKGDIENRLYFITSGVQRIFYQGQKKEATLVFSYTGSFGGVIDSFFSNRPSGYFYQTLTQTTFLYTTRAKLKRLMKDSPQINEMILLGVASAMSGLMERLIETQCYSSQEKFEALLSRSPHVLNIIPHKYLANYIGIDATNFSKLANSVRI